MLWTQAKADPALLSFTVDDGHLLDAILLPYDLAGTKAHVAALVLANVLSPVEATAIEGTLNEILELHGQGNFTIRQDQEDSHTAIEEYVTQKQGALGQKMHAGRSRNDQALTALRLYAKDQLQKTKTAAMALADALVQKAAQNDYPMPGYTHMQKAMPYTTAKWLEAFAQSLADDTACLEAALALNDQSPLGSGAGYGSSVAIDRKAEANTLGFSRVQQNTLYCQNSRGKIELFTLAALDQTALTLNKLACDILLFSTAEYGFIKKPEALCTGSSMMPQKKNPDVMELIRAKTAALSGRYATLAAVHHNLPSGYHRDFQETKGTFIKSVQTIQACTNMAQIWVTAMTFNPEKLAAAMTNELYATERALLAVKNGTPFRQAYHQEKVGNKKTNSGI